FARSPRRSPTSEAGGSRHEQEAALKAFLSRHVSNQECATSYTAYCRLPLPPGLLLAARQLERVEELLTVLARRRAGLGPYVELLVEVRVDPVEARRVGGILRRCGVAVEFLVGVSVNRYGGLARHLAVDVAHSAVARGV